MPWLVDQALIIYLLQKPKPTCDFIQISKLTVKPRLFHLNLSEIHFLNLNVHIIMSSLIM
jgi:hypothetical protein